jgi:tRNA 5-methylaminomethyl-2-thiouridine biosynthesis bifunctional protein
VDDSPRSRLSRSGTRLMLDHARRLLVSGQDWAHTGVLELREPLQRDLLHPEAGWVKPAQLVYAWLRQPGVVFTGNARVSHIDRQGSHWVVTTASDTRIVVADHVVFANAYGSATLLPALAPAMLEVDILAKLAAMQEVHGLLSHGSMPSIAGSPQSDVFPDTPVNGNGSLIAGVPTPRGKEWFAGATFTPDTIGKTTIAAGHRANHARLNDLLPEVGTALRDAFDGGSVLAWTGTRCVTHDRLPLVGPVQAGDGCSLWITAGMGARGLSLSALCAELLVAQICGEPLPVEASLVRSLSAQRMRRKRQAS